MKKTFALVAFLGAAVVISAQTISFENTTIDYGKIKQGADGQRVFVVKNTGDKPLIISKVQPSCGCTTPEWNKEPIMPGATSEIKVGYDTKIVGNFQKLIQVTSNDPANTNISLYIKGNIESTTQAASVINAEAMSVTQEGTPVRAARALQAQPVTIEPVANTPALKKVGNRKTVAKEMK
jgi:hypothetical protein